MGTRHNRHKPPPDDLARRETSDELVKLIRKLRWMGMEEEAGRVQDELSLRRVVTADSVVASPHDTD